LQSFAGLGCALFTDIEFLRDGTFIALSVPGEYRIIDDTRVQLDYRDGDSVVWEYRLSGDTLTLSMTRVVSVACRFTRAQ
jgi:hypothetical protein